MLPRLAARSSGKVPWEIRARSADDTARYCRTRATVWEKWRSTLKGWGACPETGTSTMLGKIMIALTAASVVTVVPTMSASAQQKSTQQKKVTVNIPKQVCEMLTVETQNWGQQTVQVCGPPGGPHGQARIKLHRPQNK